MNDVLELCKYIINYYNKKPKGITQVKLQKLLYFVQVKFIIELNEKCFEDELLAYSYGAVVERVIDEYKYCGNKLLFEKSRPTIKNDKYVNEVLDFFLDYSDSDLMKIIYNQPPFRDVYNKEIDGIITIESIKEFFKEKFIKNNKPDNKWLSIK